MQQSGGTGKRWKRIHELTWKKPVKRLTNLLCSLLLVACTSVSPVVQQTPVGAWHLVKTIDGDTADLTDGAKAVRIRMACIDADERRQPHGTAATRALEGYLAGKSIVMQVQEKDRYNRTVAYLIVDGENVNLLMISTGNAHVYPKYCKRPEFFAAEAAARAAHVGVWADENPERPWMWRKAQREGK